MRVAATYTATIYVGTRVGYGQEVHSLDVVRDTCQRFVDDIGLCVTVTPTEFIYSGGNEPGAAIGLINYPRFPTRETSIRDTALALAKLLMDKLGQQRVSVVFPDRTIMLSREEEEVDGI